jgi:O-antigen/teichoic acid export membrane protein
MNSKIKNGLLKNGIYNVAGGVIRITLGMAVIPVLIRSLGLEEYGLWTLASSVLGVVSLAEAGLSTATTVFISQDLSKEDINGLSETITISLLAMLLLSTIAGAMLYFSCGSIVSLYTSLNQSQSSVFLGSLQIGAFVVWFRLFQQVLVGIEQAYQRYDLVNIAATFSSVLTSFGMIGIVLSSGKTLQIMQYQLLTSIVFFLMHIGIVQKLVGGVKIKFSLDFHKASEIGKYSILMWISSIGGVIFTRVDRLVIGSILNPEYLGIYSLITDIAGQINVLSAMAVQPLISSLSNQIDIRSSLIKKQIKKSLLSNLYISLFLCLCINLFADIILSILLKQDIASINHSYLVAFRLGVLIYSLYSVNGSGYYVLLGTKHVGICSKISLSVGLITVLLIYVGAVNFGLIGAILGNSGFLGVYAFTITSMSIVGIRTNQYLKDIIYPIICLVTSSILLTFMNLNMSENILISLTSLIIISILVKESLNKMESQSTA